MQNNLSVVILAFKRGSEIEDLRWFIRELEKDLDKASDPAEPEAKHQKVELEPEEQKVASEIAGRLQEHEQCQRVAFCPSRCSFKVIRTDKATGQFTVKNLNTQRKRALKTSVWDGVVVVYDQAFERALEFLKAIEDKGSVEDTGATSPPRSGEA